MATRGPLRKIVGISKIGDNNVYGSGDKVLLECGHEVWSKGIYRARCYYCKREAEKADAQPLYDASYGRPEGML